jgi:hypothetical protein
VAARFGTTFLIVGSAKPPKRVKQEERRKASSFIPASLV